jgi:4-amino-4-deoxy-L-arabinose transferase-like glycosyltransferase
MAVTRGRAAIAGVVLALMLPLLRFARAPDPLRQLKHTPEGLSGSFYFPRGGPYVLGFESPGEAELFIDGQRIAAGTGKVIEPAGGRPRLIYDKGPHAVLFRAGPGARLLWHPPGRRGDPEYVLASSLSPEPPETARFAPSAGAARGAAAVVTTLLLLLVGLVLLGAWPRAAPPGAVLVSFAAVFALALAIRLVGLSAAGQTWDEDVYFSSGKNYLINWLRRDFSEASWRWNFEHPPLTKYLAGVGALWQDGYGCARAVFAVLSAATCVLVVDLGRRWFRLRVGVIAGLVCALLPHLLAHATVIGHETPSVFLWTFAVWLCVREPMALGTRLVCVGIAVGLALATRFPNLLLGGVVGVALLCAAHKGERARTLWLGALLVPVVAAATLVIVWPRLWWHPLAHLSEAWAVLRRPHGAEPYLGHITQHPPWHYFPVYVLATTPLFVLVLSAVGLVRTARARTGVCLVLLAWLLCPLGVAASPVRQDGVRYVLPLLVPLALLAAAGLDALAERVRYPAAPPWLAAALGLYLAVTCARIYPYYLDYYGEQVGGAGRVAERRAFEMGWWGEGIGDAVSYVNAHAVEGASVYRRLEPNHVSWFRADLWRHLRESSPDQADWLVVNGLSVRPFVPPADAVLAYEVSAQGAPLVRVYRRPSAASE